MKRLKASLLAKIIAGILFWLSAVGFCTGFLLIAYLADLGFYGTQHPSFYGDSTCHRITRSYANHVYYDYYERSEKENPSAEDLFWLEEDRKRYAPENTNFFFTVTDTTGRVLLTNMDATKPSFGTQITFTYEENGQTRHVNAYVRNPITAHDDYYLPYTLFQTAYSYRYVLIGIVVAAAALAAGLFVFLMAAAGYRKGVDGIVLNFLDKIPLDLLVCMMGTLMLFIIIVFDGAFYDLFWTLTLLAILIAVGTPLGLIFCMSFATRFKAGKWWRNTIVFRIFSFIRRVLRATCSVIADFIQSLPLIWKSVAFIAAWALLNFFFLLAFFASNDEFLLALLALIHLVALGGLCFIILQLQKLKAAGERIAQGDFATKVDTRFLFWDLKQHARTLNNIGLGMSKAVEERLRSERFKTELITNVSHDIKTPLTSIVSYVDLLKKEPIENQTAAGYVEVLERQSARLKKLIEDLVEASKASTGSIPVNAERTNLVELLTQSAGEYAQRFEENQLEAIIDAAQPEVMVMADGRLLWRVFDNLLGNICNYGQPGTRVYLNVDVQDTRALVTLRNISKYALNMPPDELMERFVRADNARSTEGSGLGLSIAKSLTELQNGNFTLSIDGDLFKVILEFDRID